MAAWTGVDLDGTLAVYHTGDGIRGIGPPIPEMVERVKGWVRSGRVVKIFTARAYQDPHGEQRRMIEKWCLNHIGYALEVTCTKDFEMVELWDDRAVQVVPNTGKTVVPLSHERRRRGRCLQTVS